MQFERLYIQRSPELFISFMSGNTTTRLAGNPLDTKHPAIRETLRGIGRNHGSRGRRSAALATTDLRKLSRVCELELAGDRDRALLLTGFAGALRRSELVAIDVERLT